MSFNWDDSRDWVSFSKQTVPNQASAQLEEVGAHPDKLDDATKQSDVVVNNGAKEAVTDKGSKGVSTPSRSYTKCTGAIPFVHKHACVTIGDGDAKVQLTSATKEEINILYNGLDDIFNEIDDDYHQNDEEQEEDTMNMDMNINNAMMVEVVFSFFFFTFFFFFL